MVGIGKECKSLMIEAISESLQESKSLFIANFSNIKTANLENLRKKLSDELKELEIVAYSKPFTIDGKETVKMDFKQDLPEDLKRVLK